MDKTKHRKMVTIRALCKDAINIKLSHRGASYKGNGLLLKSNQVPKHVCQVVNKNFFIALREASLETFKLASSLSKTAYRVTATSEDEILKELQYVSEKIVLIRYKKRIYKNFINKVKSLAERNSLIVVIASTHDLGLPSVESKSLDTSSVYDLEAIGVNNLD
jgi:hypothetical protein